MKISPKKKRNCIKKFPLLLFPDNRLFLLRENIKTCTKKNIKNIDKLYIRKSPRINGTYSDENVFYGIYFLLRFAWFLGICVIGCMKVDRPFKGFTIDQIFELKAIWGFPAKRTLYTIQKTNQASICVKLCPPPQTSAFIKID